MIKKQILNNKSNYISRARLVTPTTIKPACKSNLRKTFDSGIDGYFVWHKTSDNKKQNQQES